MKVSEFSVFLCLLLAPLRSSGKVTEELGELKFSCPAGWQIYNGNCFLTVDLAETFSKAAEICSKQGAYMIYFNDKLEYDNFISSALPRKMWTGFTKNDTGWYVMGSPIDLKAIPGWGVNQPAEQAGDCVVVDPAVGALLVEDCDQKLPYMCRRQACLDGYMSCDEGTRCVHQDYKCDMKGQCMDWSDEIDCPAQNANFIMANVDEGTFSTGVLQAGSLKTWILEAPIGKRIRLYTPSMTLEQNVAFMEIWTGSKLIGESRLLKTITGGVQSGYIFSDNNFVIIRLYANNVLNSIPSYSVTYRTNVQKIFTGEKELLVSGSTAILQFPFQQDSNKPKDLELTWKLKAQSEQLITYYIEVVPNSGYVYNKDDWYIPVMTSERPSEYMKVGEYFVSGSNEVLITMKGVPENSVSNSNQVRLRYKSGCGTSQPITDQRGAIYSPHNSCQIPNGIECSWQLNNGLQGQKGLALKLNYNLTDDPRATFSKKSQDVLQVFQYNRTVRQEVEIIKYVSGDQGTIIHSPDGKFDITFTSDVALQSNDFTINFGTDCSALDVSDDTMKDTQMTFYDEKVVLTCPTGYNFHLEKYASERSLTLSCEGGVWMLMDQPLPEIPECRIVYCGVPTKISNGFITNATGTTYQSEAMYDCDPGFTKPAGATPMCDEHGNWIYVPVCSSAACNYIPDNFLANGAFKIIAGNNFTGNQADFNTVVEFSCNDGFELIGPVISYCTENGWTHVNDATPPSCQHKRCPVLRTLPHSRYNNVVAAVNFGSSITLICDNGYHLMTPNGMLVERYNMTCQENKTFDFEPMCRDKNECNGTNNCDQPSTMCVNKAGSYECACKSGYRRDDQDTYKCEDIHECTEANPCDTQNGRGSCIEMEGSYSCSCNTGYALYTGSGYEGFPLAPSETGLDAGDVYRINHTCVPLKCPDLMPVAHGKYLTTYSSFHYTDTVDIQCDDGYYITGEIQTVQRMTRTCSETGTWDANFTCSARTCDVPSNPSHGAFDKTNTIEFGEMLSLTCNMTETTKSFKRAYCIFENGMVRLGGDNISVCPEIDCGDPNDIGVMPDGGATVTVLSTTYFGANSVFNFSCSQGYDPTGTSESNSSTVMCKANGRWSFGTLGCIGKMCDDPGTPGDAVQVVTSYAVGSSLSYSCNREGYLPEPNLNYTCELIGNNAVWSDSLSRSNLPVCKDKQEPTITCMDDTAIYYPMDRLSLPEPLYSDNDAIFNVIKGNNVKDGDFLTASTDGTISYTVGDFNSNTASCSRTFKVYDRNTKPSISCPTTQTVKVSNSSATETYNVKDWVTVNQVTGHNTSVTYNRNSITADMSTIGQSFEVIATARFDDGPLRSSLTSLQTQCSFQVNVEASACFESSLFADPNAVRDCVATTTNEMRCNSTCRGQHVYSSGVNSQIFTCTGGNVWDYDSSDSANRFCLPIQASDFTVNMNYEYVFTSLTNECTAPFTTKISNELSRFETSLSQACGIQWDVRLISTQPGSGISSIFLVHLRLVLVDVSATSAQRTACVNAIKNNPSMFNFANQALTCSAGNTETLGTVTVRNNTFIVDDGAVACRVKSVKITSVSEGEICVPCGPGKVYVTPNGVASCATCSSGQYQPGYDTSGSCTNCSTGLYPVPDQTRCQVTCPPGFSSSDHFYPCQTCPEDTYWASSTSCLACPNSGSTVGAMAVINVNGCYDPCPAGSYSTTGYNVNGCIQCPLNFYNSQPAQTECQECDPDQVTAGINSTASSSCQRINTTEKACDGAYCSGHGSCTLDFHRRVCTCEPGYYGDQCENMRSICTSTGGPCTNGATCIPGNGPLDYNCTCSTHLDTCEMRLVSSGKVANTTVYLRQFATTLDQCKTTCLNTPACTSFSYGAGFCTLLNKTTPLMDSTFIGASHYEKDCHLAFKGENCEMDNLDECATAGCHNDSKCMDKVGGFQCMCPSSGGLSGQLCSDENTPCSPDPCVHGKCKAFGSVRYECTCNPGFKGLNCSQNINECDLNPGACLYGGTCSDVADGFTCSCPDDFTGDRCEITPTFCQSSDCDGNTCYDSLDERDGKCECNSDFFEPVKYCKITTVNNSMAGEAVQIGSNIYGVSQESCTNMCQENTDCAYATYYEQGVLRACQLYRSENYTSTNVSATGRIEIIKDCTDQRDYAYNCRRTKQPCDDSPCMNGTCNNNADGFTSSCACEPGFTGSLCQHAVDDCVGNQCQNGATCEDKHLTYTCVCPPGYNGTFCGNQINNCPTSRCNLTQGSCENLVNDYRCNCFPGYTGRDCEDEIDECNMLPCQHGAQCTNLINDYECICTPGWTGRNCEQIIDHCDLRECGDGQCFNLQNISYCRCEGGATGDNCETAQQVCEVLGHIDVCTDNGYCDNQPGTAKCTCLPNRSVDRCYLDEGQERVSGPSDVYYERPSLSLEQCKNRCLTETKCTGLTHFDTGSAMLCYLYEHQDIDTVQGGNFVTFFKKVCPVDYNGVSCEYVKDWCKPENDPCMNGATCQTTGPTGYQCECKDGFYGVLCEKVRDPCLPDLCRDGATCRSSGNDFICQCPQGKVYTNNLCRDDMSTNYLFVNNLYGLEAPSLLTPCWLESNAISFMMQVRMYLFNEGITARHLFRIDGYSDLGMKSSQFVLYVNDDGIFTKHANGSSLGIKFSEEFGVNLLDGKWHHFGVTIDKDGWMSATIDATSIIDKVNVDLQPDFKYFCQAWLGYGYMAEFTDVTIWNRYLSNTDFALAKVGTMPTSGLIQGWWNYKRTVVAARLTMALPDGILDDPTYVFPKLDCELVDNVDFTSDERIVEKSVIEAKSMYPTLKAANINTSLEFKNSLPDSMTWGYYPNIIIAMDPTTKNYAWCPWKTNVYIRYNEECPAPIVGDGATPVSCGSSDGVCDLTCIGSGQAVFAKTPRYMACEKLGVWYSNMPSSALVLPGCSVPGNALYKVTVSFKVDHSIPCTFYRLNNMQTYLRKIFKEDLNDVKWVNICPDTNTQSNCENLVLEDASCDADGELTNIRFSIDFPSPKLSAVGGGMMDVEDALKIIVLLEQDINFEHMSGEIVNSTVSVKMMQTCGSGYSLVMLNDLKVCAPCGKGWYYHTDSSQCKACDLGYYQDGETQTSCTMCSPGTTTYQVGADDSMDCVETCDAGSFYNEDTSKCEVCPRHYYQHEEGKNFCYPCAIGYKTVANNSDAASDCNEDCAPGLFREANGQCTHCPRGYWRSLNYDDCQKCDAGKTTLPDVTATDKSFCNMDICTLGQYWDTQTEKCTDCKLGEYQDEMLMLECKQCPDQRTTKLTGSDNRTACEFYCDAGLAQTNSSVEECTECPRRSYKTNADVSSTFAQCKECPIGKTTDEVGQISEDNCTLPVCGDGNYIKDLACEPCPIDYYSDDLAPSLSTQCMPCGESPNMIGTEGTGSTSSECKRFCTSGYQMKMVDGAEKCERCMRGYYKTERFTKCVRCSENNGRAMTTDIFGATSPDYCNVFDCEAGFIHTENGCQMCEIGFYQSIALPLSTETCKACPMIDGLPSSTRETGTNNASLCEAYCPAGEVLNLGVCKPCDRGSYKGNVGNDKFKTMCTSCGLGLTTERVGSINASQCSIPVCGAGEYIDGNRQCASCPMDTFSTVELPTTDTACINCSLALECADCQVNYGTEAVGSSSFDMCIPICPGGQEFDSDVNHCVPCAQGSYKIDSDRFAQCTSCGSQFTTHSTGANDPSLCNLRNCQPGTYIDGNGLGAICTQCAVGYYQNQSLQTSCYECGTDLSTDGPGKTSFDDCQIFCGAGKEATPDKSSCIECVFGTFKNTNGFASCMDCPTDLTSNIARTECDVVWCSEGRQPTNASNLACDACSQGFFKTAKGNSACTECPAGVTTDGEGQTTCSEIHCIPGETLDPQSGTCVKCSMATYKPLAGNQACTPCDAGFTTAGNGSVSSSQCNIVICPVGKYRDPGQISVCTDCPRGTYQNMLGQTACQNCSAGFTTMQKMSNASTDCVPICMMGEAYNSPVKVCELCAKGTFKATVGNTVPCEACPTDTTTVGTGSTSRLNCTENLCPMGTFYKIVNKSTQCQACPVGEFNNLINQPACKSCPQQKTTYETGTVYEADCIDECLAGYGFNSQSQSCQPCQVGEYNDNTGDNPNTCKLCPANLTNYVTGSIECKIPTTVSVEVSRMDLTITLTYQVVISTCSINFDNIKGLISNKMKDLFKMQTTDRYGGMHRFCTDDACNNLDLLQLANCNQTSTGKHEIDLEFKFSNISEYVTDTRDNGMLLTREAISQILILGASDLTPVEGSIVYKSFSTIVTVELCGAGEEISNTVCVACGVGTYGTDGTSCMSCPLNKYQNTPGAQMCEDCPGQTYTKNIGSTQLADCLPICQMGEQPVAVDNTCQACAEGFYKNTVGNDVNCTACPFGKTTPGLGSISSADCYINVCSPGTYVSNTSGTVVCVTCPKGTYSSTVMASSCTACGNDRTTLFTGADSVDDCIVDCNLGEGYNSITDQCESCSDGQYNDKTGQNPNTCKYCPEGTTSSQSDRSTCNVVGVEPVPETKITIEITFTFTLRITSCASKNSFKDTVGSRIRNYLLEKKNNRYRNDARTFCTDRCSNVFVTVGNCSPRNANGRRKRQTTSDFDVEFLGEIRNVSSVTSDSEDGNSNLPTQEVVTQLLDQAGDELSIPDAGVTYTSASNTTVTDVCGPGEQPDGSGGCDKCILGRYSENGTICQPCPTDMYQDTSGASSCKMCPLYTFINEMGSTGETACISWCSSKPTLCNNHGQCRDTGRRTATCDCDDGYEGSFCQTRQGPKSNLPIILGVSIGGGGALLIIILIVVGCMVYMSSKDKKPKKRRPKYRESDYYDKMYDNAAFQQVPAMGPYPSLGYPALGYKPDTSFDAHSMTNPYRNRPSINGDPAPMEDETHFVWQA